MTIRRHFCGLKTRQEPGLRQVSCLCSFVFTHRKPHATIIQHHEFKVSEIYKLLLAGEPLRLTHIHTYFVQRCLVCGAGCFVFLNWVGPRHSVRPRPKDEVCMEIGACPTTAAALMLKMTSNSGALPGPPAPLPLCDGDAGDQPGLPPPLPNQPDDAKKPDPQPKEEKKQKQPKPPASWLQFTSSRNSHLKCKCVTVERVCVCVCRNGSAVHYIRQRKFFTSQHQGSQLELMVSDEGDIAEFARRWVQAASEAAGACAKVQADLEALESQGELINLLSASSKGISESRKRFTSLGANPTVEGVQGVLQTVHRLHISFVSHASLWNSST